MPKYSTGYNKCEVIGFVEDVAFDGTVIKEIPYVNLYCSESCDYKENRNNYITWETIRVFKEPDEEITWEDALNLIIDHFKIDTISLGFESETKFVIKVGSVVKYLCELQRKGAVEETDNLYEAIHYLKKVFYTLLLQQ